KERTVRVLPDAVAKLEFRFIPAAGTATAGPSLPAPDSESSEQLFQRGVDFAEGKGVPQNDQEAVKYLRLAAERKHARAENYLGYMYENGRGGLPKDDTQAVDWYRKAADHGDGFGQTNLGFR